MWRSLLLIAVACGGTSPPVKQPPPVKQLPASLTVPDRGREPRRLLRYPAGAASGEVRVHREWKAQHTDSHRPDQDSGLQLTPYVVDSVGRCQLLEGGAIEVVIERETGDGIGPYPVMLRYRRTPLAFEQTWEPLNDPHHVLPSVLPARWPDAAVGAGARWEDASADGARHVWEVVAIDGDRVSLRGTGSRNRFEAGGNSSWSATVELAIDLRRFRLEASGTFDLSGSGRHSMGRSTFSRNERVVVTIE